MQTSANSDEFVILAPSKGINLRLKELWAYRELLYFMTWRDVKVRYKQTLIGLAWAVLQPVLTMIVFTLFFHNLAQVPSAGNIPYPLFTLAGLVPWSFFSSGLTKSTTSLVTSSNLLKKIYFPRLIIPIAAMFSALVDFGFAFIVLLCTLPFFSVGLTINVLWLPVLLLLGFITALGVGLWFSAMNVQFRDVGYVIPFVIQLWMFATPVVYSSERLGETARLLYGLNPMAGVIEGFRWALLGANPPGPMIFVSAGIALLIFITGLAYFSRLERTFADVV